MNYSQTILAETSLLSYWPLNESSGTTAIDYKDSNNGTYSGSYTLNKPGYATSGRAVLFSSASVTIPTVIFPGDFSFEALIKLSTVTSSPAGIITDFDGSGYIIAEYNGNLAVRINTAGGWFFSTIPLNINIWQYIVVTVSAGGNVNIYLDTFPSGFANLFAPTFGADPFYIGKTIFDGTTTFFNGLISNVAVYNMVLTSSQINNHFTAASANFGLSLATVLEIQTTGDDGNAGGFDPTIGTIDYTNGPYQKTIVFNGSTITAVADSNSAVLTISGYSVLASDVGNSVNITGGLNFIQDCFTIISVDPVNNTWTLNFGCTLGFASGMTGVAGGALASLYQADLLASQCGISLQCYIKSGTYSFNSSNLYLSLAASKCILGYATNRTPFNNDVRPVFQPTQNSLTILYLDAATTIYSNIDIQNPSSHTGITGIDMPGGTNVFYRVNISNCNMGFDRVGIFNGGSTLFYNCSIVNCIIAYNAMQANNLFYMCSIINGGSFSAQVPVTIPINISANTGNVALNCIVAGSTDNGAFAVFATCINCVAHNIISTGAVAFQNFQSVNCIVNGVSAYGFQVIWLDGTIPGSIINCAARGCGTGFFNANFNDGVFVGPVQALSADPFVASGQTSSADFTVTSGFQDIATTFPGTTTITYNDLGSIQHQDVGITAFSIAKAAWNDLLTNGDFYTIGSIGNLLLNCIDATISSRLFYSPTNFNLLGINSSGYVTLQPNALDNVIAWNNISAKEALFYAMAGVFGVTSSMETGTVKIKDLNGLTTATISFDLNNNRVSVNLL